VASRLITPPDLLLIPLTHPNGLYLQHHRRRSSRRQAQRLLRVPRHGHRPPRTLQLRGRRFRPKFRCNRQKQPPFPYRQRRQHLHPLLRRRFRLNLVNRPNLSINLLKPLLRPLNLLNPWRQHLIRQHPRDVGRALRTPSVRTALIAIPSRFVVLVRIVLVSVCRSLARGM
jgi:hypothetical protein